MSLQNGQRTEAESKAHLWLHFTAHEFTPQQAQDSAWTFFPTEKVPLTFCTLILPFHKGDYFTFEMISLSGKIIIL